VLKKAKASPVTQDFFRTLAENRRLDVVPFVAEQFTKLLAESRDETTAEVISAHPLNAKQLKALEASLKKATGRKAVHMQVSEKADILGGLIVKVDGKVFDNSIANKIDRLGADLRARAQG